MHYVKDNCLVEDSRKTEQGVTIKSGNEYLKAHKIKDLSVLAYNLGFRQQ